MARRSSHPFDALVERFAQMFAERVSAVLPKAGSTNGGLDGYTHTAIDDYFIANYNSSGDR